MHVCYNAELYNLAQRDGSLHDMHNEQLWSAQCTGVS